ncbi:rRNA maturation RNase YbeY [Hippea jasoniae]|uniref:rRNA maturation RNase YbeY n=1 Tax=Hippea jasoniae TaxID=944479 RepID=UPI00068B284D|nr:rRNA maturation RNase YbeY [Hippea jasoniae]
MNLTVISRFDNFEYTRLVEQFGNFLYKKLDIPIEKEVNIVLCDDKEIEKLNREFKNRQGPTDVLSFYGYDEPILGDIVISIETVEKDAKENNKDFLKHLLFIIAHGFLHLLGYTHETTEKFNDMIKIQNQLIEEYFNLEEKR